MTDKKIIAGIPQQQNFESKLFDIQSVLFIRHN
jgi:hypothetical protein